MSWIFHQDNFMRIITILFALGSARYAIAGNWSMAGYSACAAGLQVFVMMGNK